MIAAAAWFRLISWDDVFVVRCAHEHGRDRVAVSEGCGKGRAARKRGLSDLLVEVEFQWAGVTCVTR